MLRFTEIQVSAMPGLPLYSGSSYDGTIKRLHMPAYKGSIKIKSHLQKNYFRNFNDLYLLNNLKKNKMI